MPDESAWNMYIFRDGKQPHRGIHLLHDLAQSLATLPHLSGVAHETALLDSLIQAGELECALFDHSNETFTPSALVTDLLADSLVSGRTPDVVRSLLLLKEIVPPEIVHVAPPEGFAFYALHPLKFADLADLIEYSADVIAVVGIRSIGTTLSAVVQAAVRKLGKRAERITVRPTGHPYDRQTQLTPDLLAWVATMNSHCAQFLVVDEGPGMSGSSFLSVGDALLAAGVPRPNIAFLCSRIPDVTALKATNAQDRWPSFASYYVDGRGHLPEGAKRYVGGGIWRGDVFSSEDLWPASWTTMERAKFLSAGGNTFYKFEGFGAIGAAVHARALKLGRAGFAPVPLAREQGYGVYPVIRGRNLTPSDATPAVLKRLADYCGFRAQQMRVETADTAGLSQMLRFNAQQEFGPDTDVPALDLVRPVITDSRMAPHKWIEADGAILKVDSETHGDDHFFPGPTDIAWDLAGTILEWDLDDNAAQFFLNCYQRASGDGPIDRVRPYLIAYSVFRMAHCKMASAAMRGTYEASRLNAAHRLYRTKAKRLISLATDEKISELHAPEFTREVTAM